MKLIKSLRISKKALFTHRLRTLLALLGIIVGVSAVIIMVAIGNGARHEVVSKIEEMGTNLIVVNSGELRVVSGRRNIRGKATTLKVNDADAVLNQLDSVIRAVPSKSEQMRVKRGNYITGTTVSGVTSTFPEVRNFRIDSGWFFSESENRRSQRVAVLGSGAKKNLFEDRNPLGEIIRIGRVPFKITGVLMSRGVDMYGTDQDDQIFIPLNTALRRVFNKDHIDAIYFQVDSKENMDAALDGIREMLRERHRLISGDQPDDFTIQSQVDLIEAQEETSNAFTSLTAGIAGISLLIGGIGILAVMLLSIRERRAEIGLRMALGARRRDVLIHFLFESAFLSLGGGITGISAGVIFSLLLKWVIGWNMVISIFSILLSFFFSIIIGLFSGVYPAYRASLLDPIEGLSSG